jgi:phospholipid/cholesterol/gamma-HCH transport system substrate-binding protein
MVANGDLLQSEKSVSTDDMLSILQSSNKNLLEITGDFKIFARNLANGEGSLGRLINDASLVDDLQSTIKNIKITSLKSEEALSNIVAFTSRLNNQDGLVNELISDTVIFKTLKETVAQLKVAATTASAFMDTMQKAGADLQQKNKPIGMLLEDEEVAKNLKEIISNLKKSSQKLDEDLEAMQHNFLLRGYFEKKEKNKSHQK